MIGEQYKKERRLTSLQKMLIGINSWTYAICNQLSKENNLNLDEFIEYAVMHLALDLTYGTENLSSEEVEKRLRNID